MEKFKEFGNSASVKVGLISGVNWSGQEHFLLGDS
jgi:hypothetical protein